MAGNTVRITATLDDKVSGGLDRIRDRFDTLGKSKGFQSVIQGVGIGAGINLYGTLDRAISGVLGVIGDSVKAAMDDQAARQALTTSILANVDAWDGSTVAMDKAFAAGIKLGFSDDEQATSLARLVAATHDVNKALAIQSTAEDLARFKHVSLAEASDALVSIDAGRARGLAQLGINVKDFSTIEERLAAVQAVAAGQAADYADTTAGKLLSAQTKINEEMEHFGYVVLPAVATGLDIINVALDLMAGTVDPGVSTSVANADRGLAGFLETVLATVPGAEAAAAALRGSADSVDATAAAAEAAGPKMTGYADNFGKASDDIIADAGAQATAVTTAVSTIDTRYSDLVGYMKGYASDLARDYFDPIEARQDLLTQHLKIKSDEQILATKGTAAAHRAAKDDIIRSLDAETQGLDNLAKKGNLTKGDVDTFAGDVKDAYHSLGQKVPAELQHIIDKYYEIARLKAISVVMSFQPKDLGSNRRGYATGGYVSGRDAVIVGERGPELFMPSVGGGTIIPNSAVQTMSGGGGGGLTVNFNSVWPPTPAQAREIAALIDEQNYRTLRRAAPTTGRI